MADYLDITQPLNWDKIRAIANSFTPIRPLDQNGIDVPNEIPIMQRAFASTANGMANNRRAEAGYSIFRSNPGVGHAGFYHGTNAEVQIPITRDTIAIAHTHPRAGEFTPSPQDMESPVPNYVFSGNQLFVTDPKMKKFYKYDIDKWNLPTIPKQISNAFLFRGNPSI